MGAKQRRRIGTVLGVVAIALLVLILSPTQGRAVTGEDICLALAAYGPDGDFDNDGFTNAEECDGIVLYGSSAPFPGYNGSSGLDRTGYLDPSGMDLFFVLNRATPSLIPAGSPTGIYSAGLNVTTHEILASDVGSGSPVDDRLVTPTQKAIRITESLNTTGTILGSAQQGTPNELDGATVYTQRIANLVADRCVDDAHCADNAGNLGIAAVTNYYILNVMAHEAGHVTKLTPEWSRRFEWHYAAGSGTVMEQSATYTSNRKTGMVTFYTSDTYTPEDMVGVTYK